MCLHVAEGAAVEAQAQALTFMLTIPFTGPAFYRLLKMALKFSIKQTTRRKAAVEALELAFQLPAHPCTYRPQERT
jgi:hypothetical protein